MQLSANRQVARVTRQDGEGSTWSENAHRKTGFSPISVPDGRRMRGRAWSSVPELRIRACDPVSMELSSRRSLWNAYRCVGRCRANASPGTMSVSDTHWEP